MLIADVPGIVSGSLSLSADCFGALPGTHYTNAYTTIPSDSFPGTLAILTGGGAYTSGFCETTILAKLVAFL